MRCGGAFQRPGLSPPLVEGVRTALSASAELNIRSGLNDLIHKSRSQGLVFNDTIHLHWTRKPVEHDPFDLLTTADPEAIFALLKSVKDGRRYVGLDANAYYAMSVSGNGARIVVRDWLESTVPEVEQNIADWFTDLAIAEPDGSGVKCDFKFGALLYGMVRAELAELPPAISTQLFLWGIAWQEYPSTSVRSCRRYAPPASRPERNSTRLAFALIKACLIRTPNQKETDTMNENLDPESSDRAYLCGRLFAVFDRLQCLALGKVNASAWRNDTMPALATRPATVIGPLFHANCPFI